MKPSTKRHLYVVGTFARDLAKWTPIAAVFHVPGYLIYTLCVSMTDDPAPVGWYFWTCLFSFTFWVLGWGGVSFGAQLAKDAGMDKRVKKNLKSRYDRAGARYPDVAPEPGDLEVTDDAQTMKGGLGR